MVKRIEVDPGPIHIMKPVFEIKIPVVNKRVVIDVPNFDPTIAKVVSDEGDEQEVGLTSLLKNHPVETIKGFLEGTDQSLLDSSQGKHNTSDYIDQLGSDPKLSLVRKLARLSGYKDVKA